jgi:hypothetical protein
MLRIYLVYVTLQDISISKARKKGYAAIEMPSGETTNVSFWLVSSCDSVTSSEKQQMHPLIRPNIISWSHIAYLGLFPV